MYSISRLKKSKYDEALLFVCREFVVESVLHRQTGVLLHDYLDYMRSPFAALVEEGLSFVATDVATGQIKGCLLAGDFLRFTSPNEVYADEIKPITALIAKLEDCYRAKRQIAPGTVLLVDIAVVAMSARRHGVYTRLREAVHAAGAAKGFEQVVGELTSTPTQNMCVNKLGHRVICEIAYGSFQYEGRYPFESITEPGSIQLVEGSLS